MSGAGPERLLVIGYGPATQRLLERLRRHGYGGNVTVLGTEPYRAYQRRLLPAVVAGRLPPEALTLPGPPPGTRLRLAVTARRIDRRRRAVRADDGGWYPYDRLVLATGTRPRIPRVPGLRGPGGRLADGVTTLRTRAEIRRVGTGRVTVLGADPHAVRAALDLAAAGREVTLVHPGPYPLYDLLDATAGALVDASLTGAGVRVRAGRTAVGYRPGKLRLDDGFTLATEVLVVSAGTRPDTRLARRAGLGVRDGVLVDERLTTDDPLISAIGGCAQVRHPDPVRPDGASCAGPDGAPMVVPPDGPVRTARPGDADPSDVLAAVLAGVDARHRPERPVTRLAVAGLDVAVLGRPERSRSVPAGAELVTLHDPARGRYARLVLMAGRVEAATVVGLPAAAAALVQLHDRDLPVPADRLSLLLGPTERPRYSGRIGTDPVICVCNGVSRSDVALAWQRGARSLPELVRATRVTTGCGSCRPDVLRVCDQLAAPA